MSSQSRTPFVAATPVHGWTRDQIWLNRDYANEKVWVLNPMHIVTLSSETKSKFVKVVESFKQFSEKWFSHVLLLIILILYGFIGAYVFITIEGPSESTIKTSVKNMRENIIRELWWSSHKFQKAWWEKLAYIRLKEFERQLHEACIAEPDSDKRVWTFWHALFFSSTIFTTIGYGHVVPKTNPGRVATIIYAFIGIPLLLMVLTDFGKLFTRGIKFVFKHCRTIYYMRHLKTVRSVGRRATLAPTQYMSTAFGRLNRYSGKGDDENKDKDKDKDKDGKKKSVHLKPDDRSSKSRSRSSSPAKESRPASMTMSNATTSAAEDTEIASTVAEDQNDYEVDDEFNLPISVAVILLLTYMMLGAAVFTLWEDWSFFESFYFVYISLSTIGFGDYVPQHPIFMMCTFVYLLFGLSLTSMCINVVQEKLSATFQRAKLRIGATMGLDVQQIMEEDMAMESKEGSIDQDSKSVDSKDKDKEKKGFELKATGIGDSLKERRERRRSRSPKPEGKSGSDSDRVSNRSALSNRSVGFADDGSEV